MKSCTLMRTKIRRNIFIERRTELRKNCHFKPRAKKAMEL